VVTIRLLRRSDNQPIWGAKVYISRHGSGFLDVGGVFDTEETNKDGEAHFLKLDLPAKGRVFVDGHKVFDGELIKVLPLRIERV